MKNKIILFLLLIFISILSAQTTHTVFTEDWEWGTSNWTIVNGPSVYRWVRGTATSTGTGAHSIYISNNNGVSFTQIPSNTPTVVHFYRDVTLPTNAENITLSFSYRGSRGSAAFTSFSRVYLFPISHIPEASTSSYALNSDPYANYTTYTLRDTGAWTNVSIPIPTNELAGQTKRLVFTWVNHGNTRQGYAIDNISLTYQIPPPPPPLPPLTAFIEDWEWGTSNWTIVNGASVYRWVRGTATSTGTGSYSMYISNNNGVSFTQIPSNTPTVVHFYRDITLPVNAENITLSFSYRGSRGSAAFTSFSRVYLFPISHIPEASTSSYALNSDPYASYTTYTLRNTGAWTNISIPIPTNELAGQTKRLVFTWVNHGNTRQGYAIDNISLTYQYPIGHVTPISPTNNSSGQPTRPTLTWNQASGVVDGYYVYRSTSTNPYNPTNPPNNRVATVQGQTNTSWEHTSDLMYNVTYHWQVVAFNEFATGQPSPSWSFTTQIAPPGVVLLSAPANGAANQPLRPVLSWQQPSGTVTGYRIYRATTAYPATDNANHVYTINNGTITTWTHPSNLAYNTTYHWQVIAYNSTGNSQTSASWSFTTLIDVPGQVVLVSPINGAGLSDGLRPTFVWQQPTTGGAVTGYYVYLGTTANPFNPANPENNRISTVLGATNISWTSTSDLSNNTTYHWQIVAYNNTGLGNPSVSWSFGMTVSDNDTVVDIVKTELLGNFPNPFNPETAVKFALKNDEHVIIDIYNTKGQRVITLVNSYMSAGIHQVVWNGRDESGHPVSSGIYFVRMIAGENQSIKRMMLLK